MVSCQARCRPDGRGRTRAAPTPCRGRRATPSATPARMRRSTRMRPMAPGPPQSAFTNTRFERLFSPLFVVPGNADYVTIDMDICYVTEDDPNFNILAYDGFLLRVTDQTPGRFLRSVLVEAFEDEFKTGSFFHYPKHFPRSGNSAYFQDMSAWAGDSQGFKHVRVRLPGMAGSTAQLRFEFTQDAIATCSDVRPGHTCGVMFDNLVVNSVKSVVP